MPTREVALSVDDSTHKFVDDERCLSSESLRFFYFSRMTIVFKYCQFVEMKWSTYSA